MLSNKAKMCAILPACPQAPAGLVCGLTLEERLRRTLEKRGGRIAACRILIGEEELHVCEIGVKEAEKRLLASLRKPVDGLISRTINRRVSLALTKRLMNSRIRPNQVSIATLLLGLASGWAVSGGHYWAGVFGAFLLQLQSVLDGVDGELARLRFQGSRLGEWLDTLSDDLAEFAFLSGLTFSQSLPALKGLGAIGLAAFVLGKGIVYYQLQTVYRSGDLLDFQWKIGGPDSLGNRLKTLFKHDFFCLLSLAFALVGRLDIVLVLGSGGAIVVLATLLFQMALRRKPEGA